MVGLSKENEARLINSIEQIGSIVRIGNSTLKKFPEQKYLIEDFLFINYLERFTYHLDSINILLKNQKSTVYIDKSIGLILRASLLDFLTISDLSSYYQDMSTSDKATEAIYEKQLNILLADHIQHSIKYLKHAKQIGEVDNDDYETAIRNLWKWYGYLFTDKVVDYISPEKKLVVKNYKSPKDLFTRISKHPLTKNFSGAYHFYVLYSKYDHFGIMTQSLQR